MSRTYQATYSFNRLSRKYSRRERFNMNGAYRTKVRNQCSNPVKLLNESFPIRKYRKNDYC